MASFISLLVAVLSSFALVSAENGTISSIADEVPQTYQASQMRVQLTAPAGDALTIEYTAYPLTRSAGFGENDVTRSVRKLTPPGHFVLAC
jgi:hypothetical protein